MRADVASERHVLQRSGRCRCGETVLQVSIRRVKGSCWIFSVEILLGYHGRLAYGVETHAVTGDTRGDSFTAPRFCYR